MRTKVEELPESRVRLEVEVPEGEVRHALEHAASDLAQSLRVPGFRKGKVPLPVVVARVGREALWQEAVQSHIDGWFWAAALDSGIRPVARPEVEFDGPPADGAPFRFQATVPVAATPEVADWTELEVPFAEPDVPQEAVDEELERLRADVADVAPAGERPAQPGDVVVVDIVGEESETPRARQLDYAVEVGSGRLVAEIEQELVGMRAGETREVDVALGEGRSGKVAVTVKEIHQKVLPPLDDDFARRASEFDSLAELRADIEARLREQLAGELETRFREDAIDALVAASRVEAAGPLVEARTAELVAGLRRSLERQGVSLETYLAMSGRSDEEVVARMREEAERSVKRELVLEAVADELGVEVPDEEVEALVREQAAEAEEDAARALAQMRERGGFEKLRADLRLKKALDEIVAGVERIPVDLARARERLWTPEKEKEGAEMKIWTPGSEVAR